MAELDPIDDKLLDLLRANARASISELARRAGVSRSTAQDRIRRLERRGIIAGYTIRPGTAHVLIQVDPKLGGPVVAALQRIPAVRSVQTVAGAYDLVVMVETATTAAIDAVLDEIGALEGVAKTTSSIILTTRFTR